MRNSKKAGFSLVELLVAMAIIAVLIAIAAFGIGILQRNSRDTQRRKVVQDAVLIYQDIVANQNTTPTIMCNNGGAIDFDTGTCATPFLAPEPRPIGNFGTISVAAGSCTDSAFGNEADSNTVTLRFDNTNRLICVETEGGADGSAFSIAI